MKKIIVIIILILTFLFLYGRYIEVNNFKIKEYEIAGNKIPESFKDLKIIHFSDILYEKNYKTENLKRLVKTINNEEPDIVIFSGDLFKKGNNYKEEDYNLLKDYFKQIDANLYKFAVIGDNDQNYLDKYKDVLYESNFILLDNENKLLFYKDNTPINIIGLTNLDNVNDLLNTELEYNYSLAIIHEPDNIEKLSSLNINTVLSGHSLGGIINIPYYGGVIPKKGAQTYINDYYKVNNTEIFISNGLGYEKFNFRLFNTPSINVYRWK